MAERLIDRDPYTGLETYHDYDPATDSMHIIHRAEATPILEANKALANDREYTRKGFKNEFVKYASIPAGVQMDWLINRGVDVYNKEHSKKVWELVNLPEYKYLKTTDIYHRPKGER
jgi:hypothetical protein